MRKVLMYEHGFMLPVARERVEAENFVPQLDTFWGGWSQWRNRMAWVLDRGEARYRGCVNLWPSVCFSAQS